MKSFLISLFTAGSLAAAGVGLAGAAAATPSTPSSPTDIITRLEAQGYEVIVTKTSGNTPAQCSAASVRPGQTMTGKSKEIHGVPTPTLLHKTMYVDLRC